LPLAERAERVVAVELDPRLAAELQQRASAAGFTPAERAGGLGGAPLAPPSSLRFAGLRAGLRAGGPGPAALIAWVISCSARASSPSSCAALEAW
jgi:hypothetical protein